MNEMPAVSGMAQRHCTPECNNRSREFYLEHKRRCLDCQCPNRDGMCLCDVCVGKVERPLKREESSDPHRRACCWLVEATDKQ